MDLEDQILELLKSASGSLLDDMALIDTLEASKITSRNGAEALQVIELYDSFPLPEEFEVERLRRTFEKGKTATDGIACKRQNLG